MSFWVVTVVVAALVLVAAGKLFIAERRSRAWHRAPAALEQAREHLGRGEIRPAWIALGRALPHDPVLESRTLRRHALAVLETTVEHSATLELADDRRWVLVAAAELLRSPSRFTLDQDADEAHRALLHEAGRILRTRGRAALHGQIKEAVRLAQRGVSGDAGSTLS